MTTTSKYEVSVSSILPLAFAFRFEALLSVLQQPHDHGNEWQHLSATNVL